MPIWLNDVLFGRMAQVTSAAKAAFLRELTITALKRCATQRPVARWRASLLRWQTWWPKKIPARGGSGASSSEYKLSQVSSLTGLDPFRRAFPALTCRAFLLRRCAAGFTWTVVPVALAPLRGWIRGRFLPVAVAPLRGWIGGRFLPVAVAPLRGWIRDQRAEVLCHSKEDYFPMASRTASLTA